MNIDSESQQFKSDAESIAERSARVLLVEDNAINQLIATEMLQHFGCSIEVANNGSEALDLVKKDAFDLVFMDCQMPVMDGYQATAEIRNWEREMKRKAIPIIALTANALSGEKEKCLQAGMNEYMTKPFTMDSFAAMLAETLA